MRNGIQINQRQDSKNPQCAFTRVELLCVVSALLALGTVVLPSLGASRSIRDRAVCINNLRRLGTAFLQWAEDGQPHLQSKFSFHVPYNAEFPGSAGASRAYLHTLVLSNYLSDTSLLVCPASGKTNASSLVRQSSSTVSYAIDLHANIFSSTSLLMMDGDVEGGEFGGCNFAGQASVSVYATLPGAPESKYPSWSATNHVYSGQILLADGSVLTLDTQRLRKIWASENSWGENQAHLSKP